MRILILSPSCNTSLKSHSYKSSTSTVVICWNIVWLVIAFQHFCWWMPFKATLCDDHQTTGRPRHSTTQQRVANITDDAQMDKFFESWSYILFFSGLIFKKHLVGYLPDEFNFILFMLIKFGRYNPASRCSPSLLPCAWTKYRSRCAHKYHSTSTYSVIFMLQRPSLCICLNSRFFQYLVSHLWVSTCSLITLAPPGLRRPETVLWFPIILAPSWNTVWKWELKWQSLKKLGVKSGTGGRFCSRPAGKRD